jgi:DNA ligase-1
VRFKPLLAARPDLALVTWPKIASPKMDGWRCLIIDGKAVTRKLKPIPNRYVREQLSRRSLNYLDGEILTYTDGKLDTVDTIHSKLSSQDGEPDFRYHVFDHFQRPDDPYWRRLKRVKTGRFKRVVKTPNWTVSSLDGFVLLERYFVDELGWEGIMLRDLNGRYKYGRSTEREAILLKVKRFLDDEGEIVGYKEQMHNANEATVDALGHTKRSTHQANMVPKGTLGALILRWRRVKFEVGTGMDDETRARLWKMRKRLKGRPCTFKYQRVGAQGRPIFPVYGAIRPRVDA